MALSNSRLSYTDCYELMEKAINDPVGVRVKVADRSAAAYFRARIHKARTVDRSDNAKAYEPTMPLHNASVYDQLNVTMRYIDGSWYVYLKSIANNALAVESLSQLPPDPAPELSDPQETKLRRI